MTKELQKHVHYIESEYRKFRFIRSSSLLIDAHTDYSLKTKANKLTSQITDFLTWINCHANRINSTGGLRIENKEYASGYVEKKIGFNKSTTKKGTSDIDAIIKKKPVKIEIKTTDSLSKKQKEYKRQIERTGGVYKVFRNFDMFYSFIENDMKISKNEQVIRAHKAGFYNYLESLGLEIQLYIKEHVSQKARFNKKNLIQIQSEMKFSQKEFNWLIEYFEL